MFKSLGFGGDKKKEDTDNDNQGVYENDSPPPLPKDPPPKAPKPPLPPGPPPDNRPPTPHPNERMASFLERWGSLTSEERNEFLQTHAPPSAPPLSYESELEAELEMAQEELNIINQQIEANYDIQEGEQVRRRTVEDNIELLNERKALIRRANQSRERALSHEREDAIIKFAEGKRKNKKVEDFENAMKSIARDVFNGLIRDAKTQDGPSAATSTESHYARINHEKTNPLQTFSKDDRQALNIGDNLINFNSDTEEQDGTNPGTKRKSRSRVKIRPDPAINDDLISMAGTSAFDANPASALLYKLKRTHKRAKESLMNNSSDMKLLELTRDKITSVLARYDSEARNLQVSPAEIDELEKCAESLEDLQDSIAISLSQIARNIENKKNAARPVFPSFDGNPLSFLSWQEEIDAAMTHLDDSQMRTTYKKQILGKDKQDRDFILNHLTNCAKYDDMKQAMFSIYGHVDSLLPSVIQQMRDLPNTPQKLTDENQNIGKILALMRWLDANNRKDVFSKDMVITARKKLRQFNQDMWPHHKKSSFDDFKGYLEDMQEYNFERIQAGEDKHGKNTPGFGVNSSGFEQEQQLRCLLCSQIHRTNQCHLLKPLTTDKEVKDFLRKHSTCFICLKRYDGRKHLNNCIKTYKNKSGSLQDKACRKCNNGLNHSVCPHKTAPSNPASTVKPGAGPAVTPSTLNTDIQSTVGSRVCTATDEKPVHNVTVHNFSVNGIPLGRSSCCTQLVKLLAPSGGVQLVQLLWDHGAQFTCVSSELKSYFWNSEDVNYQFQQCTTTEFVSGSVVSLTLLDKNNMTINIQALVHSLNTQYNESKTYKVPVLWQHSYDIPEYYETSGGIYSIIMGQDLNHIFPVEKERHQKLSLYQSCINDELIIAGSDNENSSI